jgi:hypothetical protein
MVCPLRLVLALASVALLLYSASVLLLDTEAGETLARRLTRSERSWWRFLVALFTGELIYSFYGKGADGNVSDDVGGRGSVGGAGGVGGVGCVGGVVGVGGGSNGGGKGGGGEATASARTAGGDGGPAADGSSSAAADVGAAADGAPSSYFANCASSPEAGATAPSGAGCYDGASEALLAAVAGAAAALHKRVGAVGAVALAPEVT